MCPPREPRGWESALPDDSTDAVDAAALVLAGACFVAILLIGSFLAGWWGVGVVLAVQ